MGFYPENELKDRKNLPRWGWLKLVHRKSDPIQTNYPEDYPPLHPKNFFYLSKVYGHCRFEIQEEFSKGFYDKKTLSIVNKLLDLWDKIKPDINSNLCDKWLNDVFKYYLKRKYYNSISTEDKLKYIYQHINRYYPDFDSEKSKHLILKYLLLYE